MNRRNLIESGVIPNKMEMGKKRGRLSGVQPELFNRTPFADSSKLPTRGVRPGRDVSSNGPPIGMPVFGPSGGEIMSSQSLPDGTATIYTEDPEDPNILHPITMHKKDLRDLENNQPK